MRSRATERAYRIIPDDARIGKLVFFGNVRCRNERGWLKDGKGGEIRVEHDSVQYVSNRKIEMYTMKTRNILGL